ncbi:MAG: restriction endonuclease [Lachnospiraceae bacterium]|nr:restriction endonuclease [Lachnospiraceae bacterium]
MTQSNLLLLTVLGAMIGCMGLLIFFIDYFLRRRKRRLTGHMDELEGHDFELFCAELLEKQGFLDVEVTRGSGDFGIDILAEKDGITYAIQCKRYNSPVGVETILQTYGGQAYYERMVGVVMTNQYFTAPATQAANKLRILLWDRGYLDAMMEENV